MNEFDNQRFDNGASYLVSDGAYNAYIEGRASLGRPDSENGNLFCSPREDIDRAIANSGGDLNKLESELGLDRGTLGDGPIHRVDIVNPSEHNLREATGNESGANCYFNTPRDENGKLPDIKFATETDGKEVWTKRDSEGREIIDVDKTKPEELAKLNGRYATTDGRVHDASLEGYKHTTSGGLYEGVTNQVPNTPQHVQHLTIDGWKRGVSSDDLQTRLNNQAYANSLEKVYHQVSPEQMQKLNGSNGPNGLANSVSNKAVPQWNDSEIRNIGNRASEGMQSKAFSKASAVSESAKTMSLREINTGVGQNPSYSEGMSATATKKNDFESKETGSKSEMPTTRLDNDGNKKDTLPEMPSNTLPVKASDVEVREKGLPEMPSNTLKQKDGVAADNFGVNANNLSADGKLKNINGMNV